MNDQVTLKNGGMLGVETCEIKSVEVTAFDTNSRKHAIKFVPQTYGVDIYVDGKMIGNVDVGSGFPKLIADIDRNKFKVVLCDFRIQGLVVEIPNSMVKDEPENPYTIVYREAK